MKKLLSLLTVCLLVLNPLAVKADDNLITNNDDNNINDIVDTDINKYKDEDKTGIINNENDINYEIKYEDDDDNLINYENQLEGPTKDIKTIYPIYLYALIPGVSEDSQVAPDSKWFGLGVANLDTKVDPTTIAIGSIVQTGGYYNTSYNGKALYPNITFNNKEYKYATTEEQKEEKGYYTLQPTRVKVDNGANAGYNKYNDVVGGNTYHQDYTIVLNETGNYTVTFNVKYPEDSYYTNLTEYSQRVKEGTSEGALNNPGQLNDELLGDITYKFDGWYMDAECTVKANFNSVIQSNTTYYGKYVGQRKSIVITPVNAYKTYGEDDPEFTTDDTHNIPDIVIERQKGEKANETYDIVVVSGPASYGYYDITYGTGEFIIYEADITNIDIKLPGDTLYDGKEHKFIPTIEGLVEGKDYEVIYSTNDFTDVGTIHYEIIGVGNYTGCLEGSYNINKRTVNIKTYSAAKEYDSNPLTDNRLEITGDGFVAGEAVVKVNGTITNPGKALNSVLIEGDYDYNNYVINLNLGTLEVTEKKITPPVPTPEPPKPVDPEPITPGEPEVVVPEETTPTKITPTITRPTSNYLEPEDPLGLNDKDDEVIKEDVSVVEPEEITEETTINEDETPEIIVEKDHWALINLFAMLCAVANTLALFLIKHKDSTKTLVKISTIIFTTLSIIVFAITEDMSLPWVLVDKYTIFMIILLIVNLLLWLLKDKEDEEEDE